MVTVDRVPLLRTSPSTGRRGSTHTEYVLIAAVVSVSIIVAIVAIGGSLSDILTAISEVLAVF
jgi:Flp pilus assembly pilin Flp